MQPWRSGCDTGLQRPNPINLIFFLIEESHSLKHILLSIFLSNILFWIIIVLFLYILYSFYNILFISFR